MTELARGLTLGNTGWVVGVTNEFRFVFQPNSLQVFVNNVMQLNINGSFNDGSMAFYNFSQADVTYSAFTVEQVTITPEPASVALMATGLLAIGGLVSRRKRV